MTILKFAKGLASMPMPWPLWLALLLSLNVAAPIYFFETIEAKVVLAAFLASMALMTAIFAAKGFVRLLGLGHIFWVPLVPWLWGRFQLVEAGDLLSYWLAALMLANSLSLILDAVDLFRYLKGEQQPYVIA